LKTKFYLSIILVFVLVNHIFAKTYTISNVGYTFSPSTLPINVGDTVVFSLANIHDAVEVNKDVWDAEGNTSNGGFSVGYGGGTVIFNTAGIFYYVCQPHASLGMRGEIIVNSSTSINIDNKPFTPNIYPNPASDVINADLKNFNGDVRINIYDITGKLVLNNELKVSDQISLQQIDISKLNAGKYLIQFISNQRTSTLSFVKVQR
jgi:plastocyanin